MGRNEGNMWYCVHALHYFECQSGSQDSYLVWEHMYLIKANSPDDAKSKGELRAQRDEPHTDTRTMLNDRPAQLRFACIRKVVECQDLHILSSMPVDGTELSYSEYSVSPGEFSNLIEARSAAVVYLGEDRRQDQE